MVFGTLGRWQRMAGLLRQEIAFRQTMGINAKLACSLQQLSKEALWIGSQDASDLDEL